MTKDEVIKTAELLRQYAEHFSMRDWDWTRNTKIKKVTYRDQSARGGYDHWFERTKRAAGHLLRPRQDELSRELGVHRWAMAKVSLRGDQHRPDGVLENASVYSYWEETGEYLQLMQPSVGSRVADFLEHYPDHPAAQTIAAEIRRHQDRYHERINASGGESV